MNGGGSYGRSWSPPRPRPSLKPSDIPAVAEVSERLCKLVGRVADEVFGNREPTDCFCGKGGFWPLWTPSSWKHDPETAIAFIERATEAAIEQFKDARPDPMTWRP